MSRRFGFAVLMATLLAVTRLWAGEPAPAKLYAVIFGVVVDENGQLVSLRVDKVIDPRSGSTNAVEIVVPKEYVAAARGVVLAKKYQPQPKDGQPVEFYTWFYFDPAQPSRADLDVEKKP